MNILGISCLYHDSAACLLRNGVLVAACQEERFSRIKHDWRFPEQSIGYCLRQAGISMRDIDCVAFYEKPLLKFERVLETFLAVAPRGARAFVDTIPSWLSQKLWLPHILKKILGYEGMLLYFPHHVSHASSSFFPSPFDEAAVLTIDGVGEWSTAAYGTARGNRLTLTHEMRFPHSLGLLYSAFTAYLGFKVNNDEYKIMGMASYGKPEFADLILRDILDLRPDGSLRLNLDYFAYQYGRRMFNAARFERLFGVKARYFEGPLGQEHYDIAASIQRVTETVVLRMAEHVRKKTGLDALCLAGGVALNSVANGRLLREGPFRELFIQPAAGDAGGAVGAAYAAYHGHFQRTDRHPLTDVYLGPSFGEPEIRSAVQQAGIRSEWLPEDQLPATTARLLSEGKVVAWFQGRMEYGPRSLGNRSILADPRRADMKDIINRKVKFRESFRPFAPAVPVEDASRYFRIDRSSPYMLLTVPVLSDKLPAITHVDGSGRVQTVDRSVNPRFHALLKEFEVLSGIPVLLNTSLNIKGEPIAMTPADAIRCLTESDMDCLVMGNCLCYSAL
ncbi:MAG: carbamoyltransferase [Nitrospirota bacterium]|nr:carbamoyltransferase [Nitrospirota bacterium]